MACHRQNVQAVGSSMHWRFKLNAKLALYVGSQIAESSDGHARQQRHHAYSAFCIEVSSLALGTVHKS